MRSNDQSVNNFPNKKCGPKAAFSQTNNKPVMHLIFVAGKDYTITFCSTNRYKNTTGLASQLLTKVKER